VATFKIQAQYNSKSRRWTTRPLIIIIESAFYMQPPKTYYFLGDFVVQANVIK